MAYVITEKAATALTRLLRGDKSAGNTGVRGGPATISPDAFPAPFTMRWSASEDSGSGAWVIWMPNPAQMLIYDSSAVTVTGITAATALTSGWYTIDALSSSSTSVYLVLTIDESTGTADAELSDSAGQASTGEQVVNILVATMATDSTTGAKRVKQYVDSTVTLGAGGGVTTDGVSTEFIPQPAAGAQPTGDEGRLQVKGWKSGTPVAQTSIGTDLTASGSNGGHVVFRNSDGSLSFKPVGTITITLPSGSGISESKTIVTGVAWNTSSHSLVISRARATFANGLCTNWVALPDAYIQTTAITDIIGS